MKLFKTTLLAAVATLAMTGAASAADYSFNWGAATDYVFRGLDQTNGSEGQLFAGVDVTQDTFYGGAWVSNSGSGFEGIEYDLYAGWKPSFAGASLDLGIIYYGYANSPSTSVANNTFELKAAATYPVGQVTLGVAAYYADDFISSKESSLYVEASAAYAINDKLTASAAYGQFKSDQLETIFVGAPDSYVTWNVGMTLLLTDHITLDGRYISTDGDAKSLYGFNAYNNAVATIKYTF